MSAGPLPAPSANTARPSQACSHCLPACLPHRPTPRALALSPPPQVYDLVTLDLLRLHEAHNGVLLSLDFSPRAAGGGHLLASGGRDGLIHIYDAEVGAG
jgi:WD40 repeat protein